MSSRHTMSRETAARAARAAGKPPPPTKRQWGTRVLGVFLLLAGGLTVVDYQLTAACQAAAFETIQRNLIERSDVIAQERAVDAELIRTLIATPDRDAIGKRQARERWLTETDRLARERAARPYPEVESCR